MNRIEAVRSILDTIHDELLIVTTGFLSRDVFHIQDRDENFYMCGSMGNAFPIGIGIALNSSKKVVVISGDGAVLMSYGSLALGDLLCLKNLKHYIIDDGQYGSTGGQPTCSHVARFHQFFNTEVITVKESIGSSPRITLDPKVMLDRFIRSVQKI